MKKVKGAGSSQGGLLHIGDAVVGFKPPLMAMAFPCILYSCLSSSDMAFPLPCPSILCRVLYPTPPPPLGVVRIRMEPLPNGRICDHCHFSSAYINDSLKIIYSALSQKFGSQMCQKGNPNKKWSPQLKGKSEICNCKENCWLTLEGCPLENRFLKG